MSGASESHYDLVVVGTGSGNTIVDDQFSDWRVAIVEEGAYGGTCLNRGCIPSKMYVAAADRAEQAARGEALDVRTRLEGADWAALRGRVFGRTDAMAHDGRDYREKQENVDAVTGTARLLDPKRLRVETPDGTTRELSTEQLVIATGSRPVVPEIPGLHDVAHCTSDTFLRLDRLPERLAVIGGGYVGAELAHVSASLGAHVVQIEGEDRLLSHQDDDIAARFTEEAARRWDVRVGVQLERVESHGTAARLHLSDGSTADVDLVLVAVGRVPNSDRLGVAEAGIDVDDTGLVVVDRFQRASVAGVWALGDASSHEPLKHVANQDARVVQHNLLHPDDLMISDHRFVPSAVFTSPQIAAVGLTEAQARAQGLDVAIACRSYADIAHGWALEEPEGHWVKLLADRATGRLVGAHLIGPQASILVQPLIAAMSFEQPVAGLARGQYWIHPALTEVVEGALLALEDELG